MVLAFAYPRPPFFSLPAPAALLSESQPRATSVPYPVGCTESHGGAFDLEPDLGVLLSDQQVCGVVFREAFPGRVSAEGGVMAQMLTFRVYILFFSVGEGQASGKRAVVLPCDKAIKR